LPTGSCDLSKLLFCPLLKLGYKIFVRNLVYPDIEDYRRNAAKVVTAAIIVNAIHKVDHSLDSTRIIVIQLDRIIGRLLIFRLEFRMKPRLWGHTA
jgi:hypothetical protein